jgi:hypothetical protein
VDAPEQTILVELSILVQPVSQVTSERQQKALEFFEAKDEEPNFWLTSVCTSPNFKDMLDLLKLSLAAFQSPSSGRQLGRLSKLIQKLVSLESSRNESYEHGKSMEVIEDIKGGMQRMIKPITEDAVDEDTASGYSSILDSVLDFQIKTIVQLDTGMSELVDGLADRNDEDIVTSNNAILDELKLRVNGMTPSLVEGQFKPKLETINKASGISLAMIPVYAVCAELALVSGGKGDEEFTHEEFALILRKAHLLMISRDRVNRKIREFNSSSGLPALKIPKSEVSFQELLDKYSGQERGAKMFADAFKDLSVVVYSRLTSDSADDKKKTAAYMGPLGTKLKQLSNWSTTPQRDIQAVSVAISLLVLIEGKTETVSCVSKSSIDGAMINHIHTVVTASHQINSMERETYNASMERLLGEGWGKAATVSMINSLLECVVAAQAYLIAGLRASMKSHAKKVQGVRALWPD